MQQLAHRLDHLGTETAFSVAQAAAAWTAKGHRVYPFHLGDINIPTAPHIVDAMNRAIADGYTVYLPGPRHPPAAPSARRRSRSSASSTRSTPCRARSRSAPRNSCAA